MVHKIYSIYDSKAQAYSLPFYYQHEGQATRQFSDWINNPETPYAKHPEDYTLFSIGTYDETTGTLSQEHINSIVTGIQLQEAKQ